MSTAYKAMGGPPASPITMKMCELLDDREWHTWEDVVKEAGKVIPPGQAIRRAEVRRRGAMGDKAPPTRKKQASDDQLIATGRRSYMRDALNVARECFELKKLDGVEYVRMVEVPPRVRRDRARARAHQTFVAKEVADYIRDGADAMALIYELTEEQVRQLALELARRERTRVG